MRAIKHLGAAARLLAFAAACLAAVYFGQAQAEMIWRRGALGDPASLDPHKATTLIEGDVLSELFEGLVSRDARGNIIPGAAQSWSESPDATVYTFQLRDDAKWSNGDKLRAEDFVYAFRRLMAPATGAPYANILYTLKNAEKINKGLSPVESLGVRALGEGALEITLEQPVPYFIEQLAHMTAMPLNRASVEAYRRRFRAASSYDDKRSFHVERVHAERPARSRQKPLLS